VKLIHSLSPTIVAILQSSPKPQEHPLPRCNRSLNHWRFESFRNCHKRYCMISNESLRFGSMQTEDSQVTDAHRGGAAQIYSKEKWGSTIVNKWKCHSEREFTKVQVNMWETEKRSMSSIKKPMHGKKLWAAIHEIEVTGWRVGHMQGNLDGLSRDVSRCEVVAWVTRLPGKEQLGEAARECARWRALYESPESSPWIGVTATVFRHDDSIRDQENVKGRRELFSGRMSCWHKSHESPIPGMISSETIISGTVGCRAWDARPHNS